MVLAPIGDDVPEPNPDGSVTHRTANQHWSLSIRACPVPAVVLKLLQCHQALLKSLHEQGLFGLNSRMSPADGSELAEESRSFLEALASAFEEAGGEVDS